MRQSKSSMMASQAEEARGGGEGDWGGLLSHDLSQGSGRRSQGLWSTH